MRKVNNFLKLSMVIAGAFLFLASAAQEEVSFSEWDDNNDNLISRSEFVDEFTEKYSGNWFKDDADRWINDENDDGLFDDKGKEDEGLFDDEGNDEGIFNDPEADNRAEAENFGEMDEMEQTGEMEKTDNENKDDADRWVNDENDEGLFDDKGKEDEGLFDDEGNDEGIFNDPEADNRAEAENFGDADDVDNDETQGREQLNETTSERMRNETDDMQQIRETGESGLKENEAAYFDDEDYYENTFDVWDADNDELLDEDEWNEGYDYSYGNYIYTDYDEIDTDGDGFVDYTEYETAISDSDLFNEWDLDEDENLNDNEVARMVFNNWDYDNSNFIEKQEFEQFKDKYLKKK